MPFTIITESTSLKPTFLYKVLDDSINGFNDDGEKNWKFIEFIKFRKIISAWRILKKIFMSDKTKMFWS